MAVYNLVPSTLISFIFNNIMAFSTSGILSVLFSKR